MSKKPDAKPTQKEAREQRLRAQLRANLQRRKGQARVRATTQSEKPIPDKG
ncbi:MAG: hypothetical protein L3J37_06390 [Rhodobacteraceae bacterium]|nr:hypothetical protein [Paracoccaceae bacterium]